MKSIFSGVGAVIVILIVFLLADVKEIIDRHLVSIICLVGAVGAFILYLRTNQDDDSNDPLPPEKFNG